MTSMDSLQLALIRQAGHTDGMKTRCKIKNFKQDKDGEMIICITCLYCLIEKLLKD